MFLLVFLFIGKRKGKNKEKSLKAVKERGSVEILFELIGELLN